MSDQASCAECKAPVEEVLCPKHTPATCSTCDVETDEPYCAKCAQKEFTPPDIEVDDALEEYIQGSDLQDLATAIRRCGPGDARDEAEHLLDKIVSGHSLWPELVQRGRYSPAAKVRG